MLRIIFVLAIVFIVTGLSFADTEMLVCNYPKYSDEQGIHNVRSKFILTFVVDKKGELLIWSEIKVVQRLKC